MADILKDIKIKKGFPYPGGTSIREDGINFSVSVKELRELNLCLYDKNTGRKEATISIPDEFRVGDLFYFIISGLDFSKYSYSFYDGVQNFCDKYASLVCGCSKWGIHKPRALFPENDSFDWGNDKKPCIPIKDLIIYTLHVRGFTKHISSKVKYRGCFEGIEEKIPYLKALGINQVELMPAYDFDEVIRHPEGELAPLMLPTHPARELAQGDEIIGELEKRKKINTNYWGYSQDAFYFAPKSAYSGTGNAKTSMKSLVKALHEAGIEIVMQFYFPKGTMPQMVVDCIRYWVEEYHIDGVSLMGESIPKGHLLSDPFLADIKLYMWDLNEPVGSRRRHVALLQDAFMYDCRRFLKSDEDMLHKFTSHQLNNPADHGVINYITNYYGFTLMDLVSYDRKHNEDNGENNSDGTDYNFSWNCGWEGPTRKKNIRMLRRKQIFSALTFLFMSAGVPKLMAGDEFGNTQYGNNNAYCQDNKVTWLDWNDADKNKDIYEFVRGFIQLRKNSTVLRSDRPKSLMDKKGIGYPDLSYHGEQAWYPHFESYSRSFSCLLADEDEYDLVIYNMYWIEEPFALPKLPKDRSWHLVMNSQEGFLEHSTLLENQEKILVPDRCCMLLKGIAK